MEETSFYIEFLQTKRQKSLTVYTKDDEGVIEISVEEYDNLVCYRLNQENTKALIEFLQKQIITE